MELWVGGGGGGCGFLPCFDKRQRQGNWQRWTYSTRHFFGLAGIVIYIRLINYAMLCEVSVTNQLSGDESTTLWLIKCASLIKFFF